jgi:hypothetical protein
VETNEIDIKGIDKADLLAALYNSARQQGMGFLNSRGASSMTKDEAQKVLSDGGWLTNLPGRVYFDYLNGRVMKVDIGGDTLEPWLYDRDNGQGAAARVIADLRGKQSAAA